MAEAARTSAPAPESPAPRRARPSPAPTPAVAPTGGGEPLPTPVASAISGSLGVDVSPVRVHSDNTATSAAHAFGARAFTFGSHVFLGGGERPTDVSLMAHEVTHVVQQEAAPRPQLWTTGGTDRYEHEARQASSAVVQGQQFTVRERTRPSIQRLGISDVLDYFADKANNIPGFRMFTIVLGVNPINMSRVDRSAANVLRAVIELIPGGGLITQALDKYGVFEKAGGWVEQQIKTLGMTGALFKQAISKFIDSLGWRDIFHLGDVWDRAKRIFTEPIDKLIQFGKGLVEGIIKFIKEAVLKPLAALAERIPGWKLLLGVLGKNPITGETVTPEPGGLISGFMTLIGQQEIYQRMQRTNALGRAWAWFKTALSELLGFVMQLPALFINTLRSLEIMDIIVLPRAIAKVVGAFGNFVIKFVKWAGGTIWKLLEIIFEVVSPGAWGYIKKTGAALRSILTNPLPFVGNLVKAAKSGFQNFASNFGTHLKNGLIDWLTGSLPGIYIPKAFTLGEIVKFVFSVLGLSWANIRAKLVKAVPGGETTVKAMETGFDIVMTLVTQGPAAAWEKIQAELSNLQQMVIGGIIDMVVEAIATKAVPKLIAMFIPGAGFISAIISIYDMVMVFVQKIAKIIQVVTAFVDSIVAIAAGNISAASKRVESILAGLLSLAISFLAGFAGLGKVADKIMGVINKVRAPIDKALDALIAWIIKMAKSLFSKVFGKKDKDAGPADPERDRKVAAGLAAIDREDQLLARDGKITREDALGVATKVRGEHPVFTSLTVVDGVSRWDYDYTASPGTKKPGAPKRATGTRNDPFDIVWVKPAVAAYSRIRLALPDRVADKRRQTKKSRLSSADVASIPGNFTVGPTGTRSLDGTTIGVTNADSQIRADFVVEARAQVTGNNMKDAFNRLIERWGYNRDEGPTDGDHVLEKQLGGPDAFNNVWPLDSSTNRSSGGNVRAEITRIKTENKLTTIVGKWLKLKF